MRTVTFVHQRTGSAAVTDRVTYLARNVEMDLEAELKTVVGLRRPERSRSGLNPNAALSRYVPVHPLASVTQGVRTSTKKCERGHLLCGLHCLSGY